MIRPPKIRKNLSFYKTEKRTREAPNKIVRYTLSKLPIGDTKITDEARSEHEKD